MASKFTLEEVTTLVELSGLTLETALMQLGSQHTALIEKTQSDLEDAALLEQQAKSLRQEAGTLTAQAQKLDAIRRKIPAA